MKNINLVGTITECIECSGDVNIVDKINNINNERRRYGYTTAVVEKNEKVKDRIELLKHHVSCERDIFYDVHGRKIYKFLKEQLLKKGDVLVIKDIKDLGKDIKDIKQEWKEIQDKGIDIAVVDSPILNTEYKSETEKIAINIAFELFNSIPIKEQVILSSVNREVYGRHCKLYTFPENWNKVYASWMAQEIGSGDAAKLLGVSSGKFYRCLKKHREEGMVV